MILERIRFMKVNKHKTFNYTPRYYDERKEKIQKIKEKYKNLEDISGEERKSILRENIRSSWSEAHSAQSKSSKSANIRLIIILLGLLLLASYILGYVDMFTAEVIDLN
ncbi:MAG: hypothetical protein WC994_02420 [Brumimicrobium sp.]